MIRIAVIGANGQAGRHIVAEALARGFEQMQRCLYVKRQRVRGPETERIHHGVKPGKIRLLNREDIFMNHMLCRLSGTKTRLLIVGGAGSLYMDAAHTQQLVDQPFFPAQYRPLASAQRAQLEAIRKRSDVQWTFISPAAEFEVSQPRTGQYVLAGEEFTTNAEGKSVVSYADYAVAVVDLIVRRPRAGTPHQMHSHLH